jgi:hypothetical protein
MSDRWRWGIAGTMDAIRAQVGVVHPGELDSSGGTVLSP